MNDVSLQRVVAFNQELAALSATGLPLDIGIDGSPKTVADKLERINAALGTRVGRGQAIEQAISEAHELPPQYRTSIGTWIRCDDPAVALDVIASSAETRQQFGRSLGQCLVYPLIILSFVYVAFWYLCEVTAPTVEAIYGQLWQAPSASLSFLTLSRNLMPLWGPLIPLIIVLAVLWWRFRAPQMSWNWVPGSARYFSAMRDAKMAEQLATLMESGCSLDESLAIARPMRAGRDETPANIIESLPPLLRWAVQGDLGGEPMPPVLRFVSQTYRATAERQRTIWRVVAPTICGVMLGGILVLGYGLSLFMPIVQLLKDVAMPGGV